MASYTSHQLSKIHTDLESPFLAAHERYRTIHDIVLGRYDYRKDLAADLDQKKSVGASTLRSALADSKASLRNILAIHLEPNSSDATKEGADRREKADSHDLLMLDPQGYLRESIHHYQSLGPFWAGWLDMHDFLPVIRHKDESEEDWTKRNKKARESYFAFEIIDKDPFSVAYMESGTGKFPLASCRVKLPYIDMMERYGESYKVSRDNPDHMLRICREHFPFIRTDDGQAFETSDWSSFVTGSAEVTIGGDPNKIWHCIDLGDKQKEDRYNYLGEGEFDNPFNDTPLLIAAGSYNPHEELPYRREGLLHPLIEIEHGKALYMSYWASVTANPPFLYEDIPEGLSQWLVENPENAPENFEFKNKPDGKRIIGRPLGTLREAERKIDEMSDKVFTVLDSQARQASTTGIFGDPDANQRLQNIPVSSVLAQQDVHTATKGFAQRDEMNMWDRALNMIVHARKTVYNEGREKGDSKKESDWGYQFHMNGSEKMSGKPTMAGEHVNIRPQDYDAEYIRSIEPVDTRHSTRAAKRAEADQAFAQGMMTFDKKLEAYDIEDKTTFKQEKYIEVMFQAYSQRRVADAMAKAAQYTAILNGSSIEQELVGLGPEIAQQIAAAFSVQNGLGSANPGSNTNMVQVSSPEMNSIGPAAASQQPV